MTSHVPALGAITLIASTVNGALGYGFSSITVPLALLFAKREFRAALALVRLAESMMTAVAYFYAGIFTRESLTLIPQIVPSLAIGVPLGALVIRHVRTETFRRSCMSVDAWIVAFGLSTLARELRIIDSVAAFGLLAGVAAIDLCLLYRFFAGPVDPASTGGVPADPRALA